MAVRLVPVRRQHPASLPGGAALLEEQQVPGDGALGLGYRGQRERQDRHGPPENRLGGGRRPRHCPLLVGFPSLSHIQKWRVQQQQQRPSRFVLGCGGDGVLWWWGLGRSGTGSVQPLPALPDRPLGSCRKVAVDGWKKARVPFRFINTLNRM